MRQLVEAALDLLLVDPEQARAVKAFQRPADEAGLPGRDRLDLHVVNGEDGRLACSEEEPEGGGEEPEADRERAAGRGPA